ncbi:MAG TPA: serine/threonine protein kinase, partial [Planctomycetaceae bacterium]|nr:serine/threonine protein kinase [Planctomycetaceae bacterium]
MKSVSPCQRSSESGRWPEPGSIESFARMPAMDPERWNRIKELFEAAAELAPEDRAAYLARACGDDAPLRSEVESLLASSDAAEDFLAEAAPIFDPGAIARWFSSDCIGGKVGPYRIVERIDEGGMGAVFLAERADGAFQSRVAIKFIRFGLESENAIARFEIERQALARLDHPGVARLLDGGTTREGAPYLVMEYIDGDPIDVYCDQRCLSVRERLRLFLQVCDAVAAAHRQLIVHRDIKPGNILVTATGQVKLLDFGVAKLLSPEDVTTHHVTRPTQRFFTPLFASPEQLRGEPVTTASDVYSLGMLLYVLLAGIHPFAHGGRTGPELERALCEETPPKPSTALRHVSDGSTTEDVSLSEEEIAVQRGTRPAVLRRILAGDLDRIVMMAIRKEPHRRYSSVEQFAEDIERFLAGQPVTATRASWTYLAQKWVVRHRVAAVAGLALAVAISGGIAGTLWEAQRARRHEQVARQRFDDVRKLANAFLFEFDTSIRDLPGATKARHLVVERALEYLKRLQVEAEDDPGLRLEIATAYLRVGDVQGNPYYPNLGDPEGARQ